jgi:hypothetical protein
MLSVFIREPEFQGQTKDKLATLEASRIVENAVRDAFDHWLADSRQQATRLLDWAVDQAEDRLKRKREKEIGRQNAGRKLRPRRRIGCSCPRAAGRLRARDIGLVIITADPLSVAVGAHCPQHRRLAIRCRAVPPQLCAPSRAGLKVRVKAATSWTDTCRAVLVCTPAACACRPWRALIGWTAGSATISHPAAGNWGRDTGQATTLDWIASGAAASHGAVSAHCNHLHKFPHSQWLLH